jgi:4-amino-4-deoxy-L-arabinose transferase-like glycosyltransferase
VAQTDNSPIRVATFPLARMAWTILILATLFICYFHNIGAVGLVGPDEPRYAWIARDMAETGDWVTPHLYGKSWFEKPVLYYWAAALCFKLFGVSDAAARLPGAMAAVLATLSMAWLAWRVYSAETARWLLLLLPTTVGMIGFSRAAAMDMPFTAMLTIAMVFATRLLRLDPASSLIPFRSSLSFTSFFFGCFLGLAVLAKGPAAIVLSGGAVLVWAIFTKRWRDALRCLHPIAIASFCLAALPWYILCARRSPDFFRVFIIEHNFKRYLTPEFQHIQPFWFYIPILLVAVFPWTLLVFPTVQKFVRDQKARRPEFAFQLFLLCSAVFPLLFFSISQSKLPGYILPAVPPLLLLFAESISAALQDRERFIRWPGLVFASSLIAIALLLFFFASGRLSGRLATPSAAAEILSHLAFAAGFAAVIVFLFGLVRSNTVALFATILFLLFFVVQTGDLLAYLDPSLSARAAAVEAQKRWPEFSGTRAATWQIKRSFSYQLNFYTHAQLPDWTPSDPKPEWLFIDGARREEAHALGFTCAGRSLGFAVIPCKRDDLAAGFGAFDGLARSGRGNRTDGQPR